MNLDNIETYLPYLVAIIIAMPFYMLLKHFVAFYYKSKEAQIGLLSRNNGQEHKHHAYERMTLFLDRLKPSNLVKEYNNQELSTVEYQFLLQHKIEEEFSYNTAQQLYINGQSWEAVVSAKNYVIKLLQEAQHDIKNATLQEYKTVFLMKYIEHEDHVGDAIHHLQNDIKFNK
jgi:hypothetical protein